MPDLYGTSAKEGQSVHLSLEPGTILRDRYEILGLIGRGGMGAVYKAADRRLPGRLCALKEIWPLPGISPEALAHAREQFLREASILARLDHPNLPKVSDYFTLPSTDDRNQDTGRDYLVMDYVPGQDLHQVVQQAHRDGQFLEQSRVLDWMAQLCDTLVYLHSQDPQVLHRDIKPGNIKLMPNGRIKLVDFGLVKPLNPEDPTTFTGLRGVGSLPYTPIEQYAGELGHTDARSDVYSLGATLYHLLTSRPPTSAQERFLDPSALVSPCDINPAISPYVEQAILAALALHPQDRPRSVASWSRILLDDVTTTPVVVPSRDAGWEQMLQENWWLFLVALAAIVAAVILTFY
jgi:serine/threonine protein kinase